jgi:translocation and assembly module TamB
MTWTWTLLRAILVRLGLLSILLMGMLVFLIATNPGLKLILNIANRLIPGTLTSQTIEGRLWKGLTLNTLTYTDKQQSINLDKLRLKWHVNSLFPLHITLDTLELGALALSAEKTNVTLDALKLRGAWLHGLHLNGGTRITLPQGILYANVKTENNQIKTILTLGDNRITIQGPIRGPWAIHADLSDLKTLNPALSTLHSRLIIKGLVRDMTHATFEAHLTQGHYQLPIGSTPESIHFQGATLNATLTPQALNLQSRWNIDAHTAGDIALTLPGVRLDTTPPPTQSITGQAHLTVASLQVLGEHIELGDTGLSLNNPEGSIHATLDIQGALNQPKLTSTVALTNGRVAVPELGLTLTPINITAKTDATHWRVNALARPNNGAPLTLHGEGNITPNLTGTLVLEGSGVTVMATPEYFVEASPNITLTKTAHLYSIDGSILIPKARITPLSFNHTVKLTRDAVFTDENADPNPLDLNLNIALDMGRDVGINIKGIQGFVDGMLHIKQLPKQAMTANGELKLREGRFEAYGQKLYIQQGELIFLGQQLDNPNLRVRAIRRFTQTNAQFSGSNDLLDFSDTNLDSANLGNQTTVGITVSGRLDAPRIKLFSSPSNLSEANILSMLLLGKPADQASKSGGQILLQAMTSMHLDSGSKGLKMLQDLQKSTGVDIDVQNNSMGNDVSDYSKTSLVVGKAITKRIYLKYNVGLFQENSSVFTLTYLLNKFLSIKVTASDIGNGIDVMYSRSD